MSKTPSTSVFVGNIPYGLTEEQIVDIFSSAGKVLSFRLVYDRETGRPKGFGFAEYPDADSAASAVRNLNDYEIMNRKLRVDFSNDGGEDESATQSSHQHNSGPLNGTSGASAQNGSSLPLLPAGTELPPGLTCPDAISRTLTILPPSQLLDVLTQMKQLVATDTPKAIELLRQAPQLSYAIFQALLLMGLVSTDALASVVEQHAAAAPIPAPPTVQAPTPQQQAQYHPPPSLPIHSQAQYGGYAPPPPHLGGQISTPPVHGQIYAPPPPQQYQPPPAVAPQPDTDALMQQVMAMPQSLIDQLPPAERAQLLTLRAQFGGQGR